MEFEFDKEIDFLLRQTAQGKTAFSGQIQDSGFSIQDSNHLDADEISAFAENALPEKIRWNYMTHLADCARCRKNLAGLIALNGDAESENINVERPLITEIIAPKIPWYRTLFAVPTLAYTMGGLILVFAGIGIFTVLQKDNSLNSQVSSVSEKQIGGKGMSSDGEAVTQEIPVNRMSSNTAAMNSMSSNSAANYTVSATPSLMNSNAMTTRRESNLPLKESAADDAKNLSKPNRANEAENSVLAGAPPPPPMSAPPPTANDFTLDGQEKTPQSQGQNQAALSQNTQNQTQIMPDTRNVQRAPMPSAKARKQEDESDELKKSVKDKSAETTVVGGKNFTRANNVWVDAAYRGQATTNFSRGSKEYKKLDSGLRGIIEHLGGTVIIVWKEKAYRIQ